MEQADTLDVLLERGRIMDLDLILPLWTAGEISDRQWKGLNDAVRSGLGITGQHRGMGDAFRMNAEYPFMVGGQFVAHPGDIVDYRVHIVDHADPITADLDDFEMHYEQYYMHVDPANHVLATTVFQFNGCTMPVAWKKMWGKGRVFYCSLDHVASDFQTPQVLTIQTRGMIWAAEGKAAVK